METIMDTEMYPYFYAANFIHKSNIVRDDSTPLDFSRHHPFASWASTMLACFAHKMLVNAALAIPIIDPWQDSRQVVMATIIWYLINYSIFDITHTVTKLRIVQLVVCIMVELFRTQQIFEGVNLAMEKYSSSPFIALSIGTISGSGVRFMLLVHRLFRGIWIPEDVEFMTPSFDTRSSFVAALVFWNAYGDVTSNVYLSVCVFLLMVKAMTLWFGNPFSFAEKLLFNLTIGVWDRMSRLFSRKKAEPVELVRPGCVGSQRNAQRSRSMSRRRSRSRSRSRSCRRRR